MKMPFHPDSGERLSEAEDRLNDLRRLLRALGLSDHARPISPSEVFELCLLEIEGLRQRIPDAEADAIRLHREKMEWWERTQAAEARSAELSDMISGAVFHFFCCGPGAHTDEDECGQFVPAMADLAKAINFDADPVTNAEIAAVTQSQATERHKAQKATT